jgi:cytochrome b
LKSGRLGEQSYRIFVWDWPTRAFHWLLVLGIFVAWWTYRIDQMRWHELSGYCVLSLIAFRIWWGFVGGGAARFSDFLRGPAEVWGYVRGKAPTSVGHNPLGGWSVLLLLLGTAATALLGLFSTDQDDLEPGPFSSYLSSPHTQLAAKLHLISFDGLLVLVAVHVSAVLLYVIRGQNLLLPMLTGWKRVRAKRDAPTLATRRALAMGVVIGMGVLFALLKLSVDG